MHAIHELRSKSLVIFTLKIILLMCKAPVKIPLFSWRNPPPKILKAEIKMK